MSLPATAFELYIKASFHVAMAVAALTYVTTLELNLVLSPVLYLFVFSSTVVSYNITKYAPLIVSGDPIRPGSLLRRITGITSIFFGVMCACLVFLPVDILIASALLGVITLLYAIPLSDGRRNLRSIYGVKIAVIAGVWAGVSVLLPILGSQGHVIYENAAVVEGLQRFLFVGVLIIPFDIRDYRSDDESLGTIPQIIGVKESKWLSFILLAVCVLLEWLMVPVQSPSFMIFGVIAILTALMVRRAMLIQSPYFASFWVEGIPVVWALLLGLSQLA